MESQYHGAVHATATVAAASCSITAQPHNYHKLTQKKRTDDTITSVTIKLLQQRDDRRNKNNKKGTWRSLYKSILITPQNLTNCFLFPRFLLRSFRYNSCTTEHKNTTVHWWVSRAGCMRWAQISSSTMRHGSIDSTHHRALRDFPASVSECSFWQLKRNLPPRDLEPRESAQ